MKIPRSGPVTASVVVLLVLLSAFALWGPLRAQEPAPVYPTPTSPDAVEETEAALVTAITYQGYLEDGGQPANGSYDMRFALYTAASGLSPVGPTLTRENLEVHKGLFTTALDFGDIFSSTQLFLQIAVRPGASSGSFTTLAPRQQITPAPQARYAVRSGTAASASKATVATSVEVPLILDAAHGDEILKVVNQGTGTAASFASNSSLYTVRIDSAGGAGGLFVQSAPSTTGAAAVVARNSATQSYGMIVETTNLINTRSALYARTTGTVASIDAEVNVNSGADALFARTTSNQSNSYAGYFVGNVRIDGWSGGGPGNLSMAGTLTAGSQAVIGGSATIGANVAIGGNASIGGTLTKGAGAFRIDHPLDPANKYLQHSFVESPDMMNIYNGNVTLDDSGAAVVQLPAYFEALNMEYRYQLTPIGAPAPNLHIAQTVQNNQFAIAGGVPGQSVSWQVTGIRQDAYANANRIQVEVDKGAEEQGQTLNAAAGALVDPRGVLSEMPPLLDENYEVVQ